MTCTCPPAKAAKRLPSRTRFLIGAIACITASAFAAVWCHEFTHILQAWYVTGHFHYDMTWNFSHDLKTCPAGAIACAGEGYRPSSFWLGEGIAHIVTYIVFVALFFSFLPMCSGTRLRRSDAEPCDFCLISVIN